MGRIVVHENVSLDGVVRDPTGAEAYALSGWFDQLPAEDRAAWGVLEYQHAMDSEAWLLDRFSFEWFAGRCASATGKWADRLRSIPKYVISSTPIDASTWANSVVLTGDAVAEVTALRSIAYGDVVAYGSVPLVRTLLEHELVDELRLVTHPVVLGTGQRLFQTSSDRKRLRLTAATAVGTSLALLTYQPARSAR